MEVIIMYQYILVENIKTNENRIGGFNDEGERKIVEIDESVFF